MHLAAAVHRLLFGRDRRGRRRDPVFAVALWIHIKTAPRKKNALGSGEEARNAILALMERDDDRRHAGRLECG